MMRHIVLTDDGINVSDHAYHRLLAVGYFPENLRDQEQGVILAAMERAEFTRVGPEHYQPSEITQAAFHTLQKRTAQLYLVGFVAIALTWLKSRGDTPSLNRASIIASCAANDFGKIRWVSLLNPTKKENLTSVTSDPATIGRIFRKYRSVAHIWAASAASSAYREPLHIWDQTPEIIGTLIKTAEAFQNALEHSMDTSAWNLWDVRMHFPQSLEDWPVLYPESEVLGWIEAGHAKATEQGLIKR